MENYPSYSYPDSGDSSPRSREIDFDNPPPSWEDPNHQQQQQQLTKVKLMVSYNGKIQPRTHDNILSYVGGETKILSVDRSLKFSSLYSKLSSILSSDPNSEPVSGSGFTFKYQLPGEDLDALISVTNDDDLENMMHEYDRLCRGSNKPARLRVFLFPLFKTSSFGSTNSDKIDRDSDRFVDALNSGLPVPPPGQTQVNSNNNNMDFLFGLEKSSIPVQVPVPVQVPIQVPVQQRHEPDPQIEARIQELNRMQISAQEINRPKSEDGLFPGGGANIPVGYWQQQQQPQPPPQQAPEQQPPPQQPPQLQAQSQPLPQFQQFHHFQQPPQHQQQQQQVYMVHHAPQQGNMYHAPMMRPVTNQQAPHQQGYYRVGTEQVYREQPVYKYPEGMGGVQGRAVTSIESGYHQQQVGAYDSGSGRQVYYAAPPGNGGIVTAPFQGVSGDMRTVAPVSTTATSADVNANKVIPK